MVVARMGLCSILKRMYSYLNLDGTDMVCSMVLRCAMNHSHLQEEPVMTRIAATWASHSDGLREAQTPCNSGHARG